MICRNFDQPRLLPAIRNFGDPMEPRRCGFADASAPPSHSLRPAAARDLMRTFYFDMKDGIPIRDRRGLEFSTAGGAIDHSRELARRLRHDPRIKDRALSIVVVDEMGVEIHREPVHPPTPAADIS